MKEANLISIEHRAAAIAQSHLRVWTLGDPLVPRLLRSAAERSAARCLLNKWKRLLMLTTREELGWRKHIDDCQYVEGGTCVLRA